MIWDALVWLAIAKIAVMLFEDASYAARGKRSPRLTERARRRAADAAGEARPAPSGGWGRTRAAIGGYAAGLVEDATEKARARRRRREARRRGANAVDDVLVDVDERGRWYADCDLCGWSSRPYRIENNARAAGVEHTRTEHPDQHDAHTKEAHTPDDTDADDGAAPRPWTPRVIPGGAADPQPARPAGSTPEDTPAPDPQPATPPQRADSTPTASPVDELFRIRHYTRCSRCNTVSGTATMPLVCPRCGAGDDRLTAVTAPHPAPDPAPPPEAAGTPAGPEPSEAESAMTEADARRLRADAEEMHQRGYEMFGRCAYPEPDREHGMCGAPVNDDPDDDGWEGNRHCRFHTAVTQSPFFWGCRRCGVRRTGFHTEAAAQAAADQHICPGPAATSPAEPDEPVGGIPAAGTDTTKETTVNLEASGPEEIRAAFATAIETTNERIEEASGVAAVLTEAADRYESLEMAASTVAHIRDAAEQFAAAESALQTATEELEAALADFNARDGQVAETVADAGNLASKEVLVG